MTDKLIVTNRSALRQKYGSQAFARIRAALAELIAANRRRGLRTALVYLDDRRSMRARRATAVVDRDDAQATKRAIDALYRAESPDYLMIVGAPDIVAQQDLRNPVRDDDPDTTLWSDLPYACDAPYSRDVVDFIGPTRVVGRLPDIAGAVALRDAAYLVRLLSVAARHMPRRAEDYGDCFALSARSWEASTRRTLREIFGSDDACRVSPPSGPRFAASAIGARSHFINCHGNLASPEFQGQYRRQYPVALTARSVAGSIREGTVAAAECCYGAQMYEARELGLDLSIAQSYLYGGAYGWLGSSTIAYGPARGNAAADLIARYFMLAMLDGHSLGRALLEARQRYAQDANELDPIDLKTLGQFLLLGDPSVHAVRSASPTRLPARADAADNRRALRHAQRAKLQIAGRMLTASKPTAASARPVRGVAPGLRRTLTAIAAHNGLSGHEQFCAYAVAMPRAMATTAKRAGFASRYFVAVARHRDARSDLDLRAVVAKEVDGRIVAYRVYERR